MATVIEPPRADRSGYQPGVCNIGPDEIARRRRAGHVGVAVSAVLLAALMAVEAPHWTRLALVLTAGGAASGYLQAYFRFCAGFGAKGVYNFGPIGSVRQVEDAAAKALDRARSNRIGLTSLAIGLAVGIAATLLPAR